MPGSTYTEHADKWKALADIDYFTHFVKAWIPFNAWYRTYYPALDTDRAAINEIKNTHNGVRNRFISLLTGIDNHSEQFRSNIAHLHYCLQNTVIEDHFQRIYFVEFVCEIDRNCLEQRGTHNNIHYYVKIDLNQGATVSRAIATVINSRRTNLLNYSHPEYNIDHLKEDTSFVRLSNQQRSYIEGYFHAANPRKPQQLLTNSSDNTLHIGQYNFVNDQTLVYKSIIEMLYSLRNVLFHGQIIPNQETNQVYEPAYKVLKMIVDGL